MAPGAPKIAQLIAQRAQRQDDLLFIMRRRLAQTQIDQALSDCHDQYRSVRERHHHHHHRRRRCR